jgi:tetratricopeptide (TPR) repeat protein
MARAYAGIAETHILMMMHGIAEPLTVMPLAREAVLKALANDPELAAARSSSRPSTCGSRTSCGGNRVAACIRSDPAYATAATGTRSLASSRSDALTRQSPTMREAERLDPLSLPIASDAAFVLYWSRRYDEAIEQCHRALFLNPSFYRAHIGLGRIHAATHQYSRAIEACVTARALCDGGRFWRSCSARSASATRPAATWTRARRARRAAGDRLHELGGGVRNGHRVHGARRVDRRPRECIDAARARRTGWIAWLPIEPLYDRVNGRVHV